MDSKLIQGLLAAACVSLIVCIALTVSDIMQYRGVEAAVPARAALPAGPAAPQPTPPAAPDLGLLKFAPAGAIGYLDVDIAGALDSQLVKGLAEGTEIPAEVKQFDRAVLFFGQPEPGAAPGQTPAGWAVLKTKGTTLDQLRTDLAAKGTKTSVEGMDAYVQAPPVPMGAPRMPGAPEQQILLAPVDDTTVLGAPDEAGLAQIIQSYKGGGGTELAAAHDMASKFAGATITGGFVMTDEMRAGQPGQPPPAWMAGAQGGALAVSLTGGFEFNGFLRLGSPQEAQDAAAAATAKVADFLEQLAAPQPGNFMALMLQPFRPLIEKLAFSAQDSDAHLSMEMSAEEVQALADMMKQMAGPAPGGMMGPPGMMPPTR